MQAFTGSWTQLLHFSSVLVLRSYRLIASPSQILICIALFVSLSSGRYAPVMPSAPQHYVSPAT